MGTHVLQCRKIAIITGVRSLNIEYICMMYGCKRPIIMQEALFQRYIANSSWFSFQLRTLSYKLTGRERFRLALHPATQLLECKVACPCNDDLKIDQWHAPCEEQCPHLHWAHSKFTCHWNPKEIQQHTRTGDTTDTYGVEKQSKAENRAQHRAQDFPIIQECQCASRIHPEIPFKPLSFLRVGSMHLLHATKVLLYDESARPPLILVLLETFSKRMVAQEFEFIHMADDQFLHATNAIRAGAVGEMAQRQTRGGKGAERTTIQTVLLE
jgi:hypothetical protein